MMLHEFIEQYLTLANYRGYSYLNPIQFKLYKNGKEFIVVHTEFEPRLAQLPKNVLWLNPTNQKLFKRESYLPSTDLDFTWIEITSYDQIFEEEQYYEIVPDDLRDLGFGMLSLVQGAKTDYTGFVKLLEPNVDAVVVPTEDPRLNDKRYPLPHDHEDFPRTMIKLNDNVKVLIGDAEHPEPNDLLFIKEVGVLPNTYIGEWRKPKFDEIEWSIPKLVSLNIYEPDGVVPQDNSTFPLHCRVNWEDRTDEIGEVIWSIETNPFGISINSETGKVTCPNLTEDVVLLVTAKKQDPFYKHWVETTYSLTIQNLYDMPISLAISGESEMFEGETATYVYTLTFESGKTETKIVPRKESTNFNGATLVNKFFSAPSVQQNETVTLMVNVVYDGHSFNATHDVLVKKNGVVSMEFVIDGSPASYKEYEELEETTFTSFKVHYSDGTSRIIQYDKVNSLTITDSSLGTFQQNYIKFNNIHNGDKTTEIKATYVERGDTVEAVLNIKILDVIPFIQNLRLESTDKYGPSVYPLYPKWGGQPAPLQESIVAVFELDGEEKSSFSGSGLEPEITWILEDPKGILTLRDKNNGNVESWLSEVSGSTENFMLKVKVRLYFAELNLTLEADKQIEYVSVSTLHGPIPFVSNNERTDTMGININGHAQLSISQNYLVVVEDHLKDSATLPSFDSKDGVITMRATNDNRNGYYNFTTLVYTSATHELIVYKQKIGFNWRTTLVFENGVVGETVELTIEDPTHGFKLSRNYTIV